MLDNIPRELRERRQWVTWRFEQVDIGKKPTKVPHNPITGHRASSTDPEQWVSFEQAKNALDTGWYNGIGYVLSKDDPYAFIDLDTYDPALTDEDRERHQKIAQAFTGYAERSPSKQGLHLIVKGSVPAGRKRGGVEVYSGERYMTMTGDVYRDAPIEPHPDLLRVLWEELAAPDADNEGSYLIESKPETIDDWTLCERAANALNGTKFVSLYKGEWQTSYTSQSEADFALIDIIAFYTDNHEQVARIFRQSELGKRDKAKRNSYVLPMVKRSFDAKPPAIDLSALQAGMQAMIERNRHLASVPVTPAPPQAPGLTTAARPTLTAVEAPTAPPIEPDADVYALPPGLLGEIAQFVYSSAPRPVQEIALTAAMGLMAGITGRSYNINGTGLNHYLLLLAPTGSGKEAIAGGISALMAEVEKKVPHAGDFVGPGEIRSDAALLKHISRVPSFVTVGGEFGHTLAMMAQQNANAQMRGIKKVMLDLYGKSGQGHVLRPTIYSDRDKNTNAIEAPAFSFIGESAPESFFNSVDEALIADGMIPRFTLIEYLGKRPHLNSNAGHEPPAQLIERVSSLCAQSLMLNNARTAMQVEMSPNARAFLDAFDHECTHKINENDSREVIRHLWNRAHLRALKLAGLVAVGCNPYAPVVDMACAQWAVRISSHNTERLLKRFEAGDVGVASHESKQIDEVRRQVALYFTQPFDKIEKYIDHPKLYGAHLIPKHFLSRRLLPIAAFRNDRMGATNALNRTIKMLIEAGEIFEVNKAEVFKKHAVMSMCFAVADEASFKGFLRTQDITA